jgi:cytochrome P450
MDPEALVTSNSILAIIAGSDTTASVLSNVLYYLMLHSKYIEHLREEVDPLFSGVETVDADQLTNLGFLNAVM